MAISRLDNALKIYAVLVQEGGGPIHAHQVRNAFGGSVRTYYDIARELSRVGYLESRPGSYGGYLLPEEQITMWDLWLFYMRRRDTSNELVENIWERFEEWAKTVVVTEMPPSKNKTRKKKAKRK